MRPHKPGREILAAGDDLVGGGVLREPAVEGRELGRDVDRNIQLVPDGSQAVLDGFQNLVAGDPVGQVGMDQVEQVGQLVIVAETLAGGRDDHHAAAIVRERTLRNCSAPATEDPPNLQTLSMPQPSRRAAKKTPQPSARSVLAAACMAATLIPSVMRRRTPSVSERTSAAGRRPRHAEGRRT